MYSWLRRLLFLLPAEYSHDITLALLPYIYSVKRVKRLQANLPTKSINVFGLHFQNPVGLAAGLDKNGDAIDGLFGLGFGFVEIGAVTPLAQEGNLKPRLFRLSNFHGLINRMGFNNLGIEYVVKRLAERKIKGIVGVNLGKNRDTPIDQANEDYKICFEKVYKFADYVSINISSPNTKNLQSLQAAKPLELLLMQLRELRQKLKLQYNKYVPILVKVSPDLSNDEIESMAQVFINTAVDGIIAVNTTRDRSNLTGRNCDQPGGLSGRPLFSKMLHVVSQFREKTHAQIPIIACGGIDSLEKANLALQAGATLIQIYTGLIYEGPQLIKMLVKRLTMQ